MKPLVITATPNICWLKPDVEYPKTIDELIQEAKRCESAGAAVLHIHAEERWAETIRELRKSTNMIIQCGMSSLRIPDRLDVFKEKADMISVIASHHDEAFAEVDVHELHSREELIEYAELGKVHGVQIEFEVWHTGSIWNLRYLIDRNIIAPPYVTTMFFGWPGGTWSPPTIKEYLYRREYMPIGSVKTVSVMGIEQNVVLTTAILCGDHVRVGTEDYPYNLDGELVETHELVAEIAQIAKTLGRPIATVEEARDVLLSFSPNIR